jgi:hypothetical protein
MNSLKKPPIIISVLLIAVALAFALSWQNMAQSTSYADLSRALTTTTATFGTLLGVITAGLMFTQGAFSRLASELNEKSPTYFTEVLPLDKIQSVAAHLLALRKSFTQFAATTSIREERDLYSRIATNASGLFVDFAVILKLKLRQQGLPDTDLLVSEMDSTLYNIYQRRRRNVRREWQLLNIIKRIVDTWEGQTAFFIETTSISALKADLNKSIALLKLKEKVDQSSTNIIKETSKTLNELDDEFSELSKRFHEDRIPQLLSQMVQASTLRGKYFYLTLIFIAAPLLVNLIILPQLSQATAAFFQPIVSVTSLLSIIGVVFLFLYIYKILNA